MPFFLTNLTVRDPVLEDALILIEPEPFTQVELGHLGNTTGRWLMILGTVATVTESLLPQLSETNILKTSPVNVPGTLSILILLVLKVPLKNMFPLGLNTLMLTGNVPPATEILSLANP